jgi:hypothetical protein
MRTLKVEPNDRNRRGAETNRRTCDQLEIARCLLKTREDADRFVAEILWPS